MPAEAVERTEAVDRASVPTPTPFDVFVLALTIFSLINLVLVVLLSNDDLVDVVLIVDGAICIIFFADFLVRLRHAPSRRGYFIGDLGWLDLVGSVPVPGFRIARVARVVWISRAAGRSGLRRIVRSALADRAGTSLLAAVFLTIAVLQYGSMAILRIEDGAEGANIQTASDALWWSYVSITTVGYGDRFPVTDTGRVIGAAVLAVGVGLFGVITGFLANMFLAPRRAQQAGQPDGTAELRLELMEIRRLIAGIQPQSFDDSSPGIPDSSPHEASGEAPSVRRLEHERD